MNKDKTTGISKVVIQFLSRRYSAATEEKVQKWLIDDNDSREKEEGSLAFWNSLKVKKDSSTYGALKRVRIKAGISQKDSEVSVKFNWARIAAIVLPLILATAIFYYFNVGAKSQMVEVYVPFGAKKQLILPDGSKVSLNSGTTFSYPKQFSKKSRVVKLAGEAFFTVTKDTSKPFIVETNHITVKVLGTQFNVKAYADDSRTVATLTRGKIEVVTTTKSCILSPNQQLTYNNKTSQMEVSHVLADEATGWDRGQLIFVNSTLDEILKTMERHFKISFLTDTALVSSGECYTIKFLRNENPNEILDVLKDVIGNFSYQQHGNVFRIKKL
jgi:ferric-dicitrate binding protein FerR (iron transport regulator)